MSPRPTSKEALLNWIMIISFALNDMALYLDTHPTDKKALSYYQNFQRLRLQALEDFSKLFYPLTQDYMNGGTWNWSDAPLPWEGGTC